MLGVTEHPQAVSTLPSHVFCTVVRQKLSSQLIHFLTDISDCYQHRKVI